MAPSRKLRESKQALSKMSFYLIIPLPVICTWPFYLIILTESRGFVIPAAYHLQLLEHSSQHQADRTPPPFGPFVSFLSKYDQRSSLPA